MHVEIWSDIACPWCYVGKRRFEAALAQFDGDVEVTLALVRARPGAPPAAREVSGPEHLAEKYGMTVEEARARQQQLRDMAAGDGLDMRFDLTRGGNTFDGHRLLQLAAEHGLQGEMKERLLRAHHTEGELLSDHETLVRLADEVGVPGAGRCWRPTASPPRSATTSAPRASWASTRCRRSSSTGGSASSGAQPPGTCCSACWRQLTAISPLSANGGTSSMRSPLQKRPGSYQLAGPLARQQPHLLERRRHELRAVDRLERALAAPVAAGQPLAREPGGARERAAVEAVDDLDQPVLVLARELALELPQPRALAVAVAPRAHRVGEHVQLHAALALARPHVGQRAAELRVPQQRRQVVERDDHPDVVDRRVGDGLDRAVGERAAAEQPQVAGRRHGDRVVEGQAGHRP